MAGHVRLSAPAPTAAACASSQVRATDPRAPVPGFANARTPVCGTEIAHLLLPGHHAGVSKPFCRSAACRALLVYGRCVLCPSWCGPSAEIEAAAPPAPVLTALSRASSFLCNRIFGEVKCA